MWHFYKEQSGNVVAVVRPTKQNYPDNRTRRFARQRPEGLAALFDHPNSAVASTSFSAEYLATLRRVTEKEARQIHPALFERIDRK